MSAPESARIVRMEALVHHLREATTPDMREKRGGGASPRMSQENVCLCRATGRLRRPASETGLREEHGRGHRGSVIHLRTRSSAWRTPSSTLPAAVAGTAYPRPTKRGRRNPQGTTLRVGGGGGKRVHGSSGREGRARGELVRVRSIWGRQPSFRASPTISAIGNAMTSLMDPAKDLFA